METSNASEPFFFYGFLPSVDFLILVQIEKYICDYMNVDNKIKIGLLVTQP